MRNLIAHIRRWSHRTHISAISDEDMERILGSLDVFDSLKSGQVTCLVCRNPVEPMSIGAITRVNGEAMFVCERQDCLTSVIGHVAETVR